MKTPFAEKVNAKYGAPMGRYNDGLAALKDAEGKVHLQNVPLTGGGCYDEGGAYWGGGTPLYCAWGYDSKGDQIVAYFRAASRDAAKAMLPTGCKTFN